MHECHDAIRPFIHPSILASIVQLHPAWDTLRSLAVLARLPLLAVLAGRLTLERFESNH